MIPQAPEKFELYNMHGRPVLIRPISEADLIPPAPYLVRDKLYTNEFKLICPDCGWPAKYMVFEIDGDSPWPWCGECAIGG